jgi:hypothetical protein
MRKLMKSAAEAFLNWARRQATGMREIMEILVEAIRLPAIPVLVVGIGVGVYLYLHQSSFNRQVTWWLFCLVIMQQIAIERLMFTVGKLQERLGMSDEELERLADIEKALADKKPETSLTNEELETITNEALKELLADENWLTKVEAASVLEDIKEVLAGKLS